MSSTAVQRKSAVLVERDYAALVTRRQQLHAVHLEGPIPVIQPPLQPLVRGACTCGLVYQIPAGWDVWTCATCKALQRS